MTGHEKRASEKKTQIIKAALELFNKYGVNKTSIDEIAETAQVSKATIYKYFADKKGLHKAVIDLIFGEAVEAVSELIGSEVPFLEKLKLLISAKSNALNYLQGEFVQEIVRQDRDIGKYIENTFSLKIQSLMFRFFEQGRSQGYIAEHIPNEIISLHIEIFKAGLQEKSSVLAAVIKDQGSFERLIDLFFYGLVKKK